MRRSIHQKVSVVLAVQQAVAEAVVLLSVLLLVIITASVTVFRQQGLIGLIQIVMRLKPEKTLTI